MKRQSLGVCISFLLFMGISVQADWIELFVHPGAARAVLLDPAVRKYLHTDVPARQPLLISDRRLLAKESDLSLPFQVLIVRGDDARQAKAFTFTSAEPGEGDTLVVTFEFAPEGLVGHAVLRRDSKTGWVILTLKVAET